MKTNVILPGLLCLLMLCGCSVKEDRKQCPLWLSEDMKELNPYSTSAWTIIRHHGGLIREEVIFKNGRTLFDWEVEKGEIAAAAYCGLEERHLQGHHLIVPEGEAAPCFHGSVRHITSYGESAHVVTSGCRQSARVNLEVIVPDGTAYPYGLLLEGDVCGTDLITLAPVEGRFGHPVELDGENSSSFQILRQSESSTLILHVIDKAKIIESIPLGEWILQTGYDWNDEDLDDIGIRFEQGRLEVTILISDWEQPEGEMKYEFIF